MPIVDERIEAYARAHTTPMPAHLESLDAATRDRFGPRAGMLTGLIEGRFLEMLVFASGARRVLEIGTFTGYSAQAMAAGLPPGGTITTLEVDTEHEALAREHLTGAPDGDKVDIRMGPALTTLESLDGPFDLVFIDADKTNYLNYYEAVLPMLGERGLIVVDNVLWSGQVLDDDDESDDTKAIRAFNDHVVADARVVCVLLTIRDGVMLVRRR
jgi:caffeoyl-CoA O-methyltransferase